MTRWPSRMVLIWRPHVKLNKHGHLSCRCWYITLASRPSNVSPEETELNLTWPARWKMPPFHRVEISPLSSSKSSNWNSSSLSPAISSTKVVSSFSRASKRALATFFLSSSVTIFTLVDIVLLRRLRAGSIPLEIASWIPAFILLRLRGAQKWQRQQIRFCFVWPSGPIKPAWWRAYQHCFLACYSTMAGSNHSPGCNICWRTLNASRAADLVEAQCPHGCWPHRALLLIWQRAQDTWKISHTGPRPQIYSYTRSYESRPAAVMSSFAVSLCLAALYASTGL